MKIYNFKLLKNFFKKSTIISNIFFIYFSEWFLFNLFPFFMDFLIINLLPISGRGHDAPNSCSGENTCASSTVVESVSVKDSGSGSRCSCRCAWCSCSGKGAHDSATSVTSLNSRRRLAAAAAQQPCSAAAAGKWVYTTFNIFKMLQYTESLSKKRYCFVWKVWKPTGWHQVGIKFKINGFEIMIVGVWLSFEFHDNLRLTKDQWDLGKIEFYLKFI